MQTFYEFSVFILGDLPKSMCFLHSIFAFILALVFLFVILSPFIYLFRSFSRW